MSLQYNFSQNKIFMKSLLDINFNEKRALMRVDFNVPLDPKNFSVTDETRLIAPLESIQKILSDGGSVILMSHLGRPKSGFEEQFSLRHLLPSLRKLLAREILFGEDCIGEKAFDLSKNLRSGEVLLLENLRFYKEEEKGNADFAQKLAKHGDIYVNDAFGTAHRAHASTSIIAQFFEQKVCGFLMEAEVKNAEKVLNSAQKPFTAIMGGAKISDKILIIEKLIDRVDSLIIGGGMSYTFFKANGGKIGKSLVENEQLNLASELMKKAEKKGVKLFLPQDSLVADKFANDAQTHFADNNDIPDNFMGLDIGEKAAKEFSQIILSSKTILWNGPMGVFEMPTFAKGTIAVAEAVAQATEKGAFSLIGGGDSAAAVNQLGFQERVSYISTGGGALLEYFEGKELPGVKALQ
jgi:phosphoglycerate kinase